MRGSLLLAWSFFFLYCVWAAALQGLLAAPGALGEWTPEIGFALLFAWLGKLPAGRGPLAALCVALGRASSSADAPFVLAAGALGACGLFAGLRAGLEVDRPLARAALSGVGAFCAAFLAFSARSVALAASAGGVAPSTPRFWPGALATALLTLLAAPFLRRLPGLARLARRRP